MVEKLHNLYQQKLNILKEPYMPCRDYRDDLHDEVNRKDRNIADMKKRLDMLSRIACNALAKLEEIQSDSKSSQHLADDIDRIFTEKETLSWWPEHKIADAKAELIKHAAETKKQENIVRQRKRAVLLSKMTNEEKELLGLKE